MMENKFIFSGSFDPIHEGHINIIQKIIKIFGTNNIIINVGVDPNKTYSSNNRLEEVKDKLKGYDLEIIQHNHFLVDLVNEYENKGYNVILIKGVRNESDFKDSHKDLIWMRKAKPNLSVVMVHCDSEFSHISSSDIKKYKKLDINNLLNLK